VSTLTTKRARKLGDKSGRKKPHDSHEPLELRERLRHQWDVLDLERRMLENAEHRVRYGLIIFGAVNTGVVLFLARQPLLIPLSPSLALLLRAMAALYVLVAFTVLAGALRSLRPGLSARQIARLVKSELVPERRDQVLLSLIPTGEGLARLSELHRAWRTVSAEQLSAELTQACLIISTDMEGKAIVMRRLYASLGVMLALAATVVAGLALLRPGT
jgi:hypothetical protein